MNTIAIVNKKPAGDTEFKVIRSHTKDITDEDIKLMIKNTLPRYEDHWQNAVRAGMNELWAQIKLEIQK